jgi:hypothetical protein
MEINDEKFTQLILECTLQKIEEDQIKTTQHTARGMVHVFNMQQDKQRTAKGLEHSSSLQQPAFCVVPTQFSSVRSKSHALGSESQKLSPVSSI